jgi:hypothetical protein
MPDGPTWVSRHGRAHIFETRVLYGFLKTQPNVVIGLVHLLGDLGPLWGDPSSPDWAPTGLFKGTTGNSAQLRD